MWSVFYNVVVFLPQFRDYNLVSSLQLPNGLGRGEGRVIETPEPSSHLHQCVGGNTVQLTTEVSLQAPGPPGGVARV